MSCRMRFEIHGISDVQLFDYDYHKNNLFYILPCLKIPKRYKKLLVSPGFPGGPYFLEKYLLLIIGP